jgi:putative transposase
MARTMKHAPAQVANLLRQIEVAIANGERTALSCKEALITEQTSYR